jgi:hypothetical protein
VIGRRSRRRSRTHGRDARGTVTFARDTGVQGGDDYLYARNLLADTLFGGAGTDQAQTDGAAGVIASVEDLLA